MPLLPRAGRREAFAQVLPWAQGSGAARRRTPRRGRAFLRHASAACVGPRATLPLRGLALREECLR